ncbi:MFS transporter [Amaricoccus tamworthensis]|uniref:MFS transporter n=1 Tax=Amaricoccus tamworthensis TaxID=57002 RepID=UPI003C7AD40F
MAGRHHQTMPIAEARALPLMRGPAGMLIIMAAAQPLAFSVWVALLNNFVVERAGFTGVEIGWLQTVREIPGFLAVGVIFLLLLVREQRFALICLAMLGLAVSVTAMFPSFQGLLITTLIGSIGFHYYETANQSLQLQWLTREEAPIVLGRLIAVAAASSFAAYGLILLLWSLLDMGYGVIYAVSGLLTAAAALFCRLYYPTFKTPVQQRQSIVLRRRYWLYYLLEFMSGARRQIFVVFAAFMMVERFGFSVPMVTGLMMVTFAMNVVIAPIIGRMVANLGERTALLIEYFGLLFVFLAYGWVYLFGWGAVIGALLYLVDHALFALSLSLKTYFQKIADPADMAPSMAVAFSINHIAAVFLPAALGYLWIVNPSAVFYLGAGLAACSILLSALIPRHPAPGHETILTRRGVSIAE